jgi:prolyl-tRNA synthetase
MKGVPIRLELGPRDLDAEQATMLRRDTMVKAPVPLAALGAEIPVILDEIQRGLLVQAARFTEEHTIHPGTYAEMRAFLEASGGFAVAPWCGTPRCEARVKQDAKATIRYLPLDPVRIDRPCIVCGEPARDEATWARAY